MTHPGHCPATRPSSTSNHFPKSLRPCNNLLNEFYILLRFRNQGHEILLQFAAIGAAGTVSYVPLFCHGENARDLHCFSRKRRNVFADFLKNFRYRWNIAARFLIGINHILVQCDLINPIVPLDQFGLNAEGFLNRTCQTGGGLEKPSLHAIGDNDLCFINVIHRLSSLSNRKSAYYAGNSRNTSWMPLCISYQNS